jgi:hypothetical protein
MVIMLDQTHVDFKEHMKEKVEIWKPFIAHIGPDYAVFEFDTEAERDTVCKSLKQYEKSYGYESSKGPREQLSIVKKEVKDAT